VGGLWRKAGKLLWEEGANFFSGCVNEKDGTKKKGELPRFLPVGKEVILGDFLPPLKVYRQAR
jgi:hypothetical protein